MTDHRTLNWAVDIIGMCEPIRCDQGGMWFGRNHNFADATFVDYGAADAFAVAAKALPGLLKTLQDIVETCAQLVESAPIYHGQTGYVAIQQRDKRIAETIRSLSLSSQDRGRP